MGSCTTVAVTPPSLDRPPTTAALFTVPRPAFKRLCACCGDLAGLAVSCLREDRSEAGVPVSVVSVAASGVGALGRVVEARPSEGLAVAFQVGGLGRVVYSSCAGGVACESCECREETLAWPRPTVPRPPSDRNHSAGIRPRAVTHCHT